MMLNSAGANYTSVRDTAAIMNNYYNNKRAGSQRVLDLMTKQIRRWKLASGLPQNAAKNGNKTGELNDNENDVLIVWAKTGNTLCHQRHDDGHL